MTATLPRAPATPLDEALLAAGYKRGDVFEICVLSKGGQDSATVARRFTAPDPAAATWLAYQADRLGRGGAKEGGCYFGSNPIKTADGGRANDEEAATLRLLLIDADPDNTTPEARAAAARLADEALALIVDRLHVRPALIDSGRGRQLWLRHEAAAPGDARVADLRSRLLVALGRRLDRPGAHVDRGVFNATRLMRMPGTSNFKTGDRAGVIDLGDGQVASLDAIERLVDELEAADEDEATPVSTYPLDVLPPGTRAYVEAVARSIGNDPALAAGAALAVACWAAGPRWRIEARADYVRSALLWPALVAPSAAGKTPAIKKMIGPVRAREDWVTDKWRHDRDEAREAARSAGKGEKEGAKERLSEVERARPRSMLTSCTPESLTRALGRNEEAVSGEGGAMPEPLLVLSDELPKLIGEASYGDGGGGKKSLMELYDSDPVRQDRVTRDSVEIDRHHAVILGGVQAAALSELRFGRADGAAARIAWHVSEIPPLPNGDDLPPEAKAAWNEVVEALRRHEAGDPMPLSLEARDVFGEAERASRAESFQAERAGLPLVASIVGKRADQALRLCAALHGLDRAEEAVARGGDARARHAVVSGSTMRRAVRLAEWIEEGGRRVAPLLAGGSRETEGDAPTEADGALADALGALLAPGERADATPSEWAARLARAGYTLGAAQVGRAFSRLAALGPPGLELQRVRSKARRSWVVTRDR